MLRTRWGTQLTSEATSPSRQLYRVGSDQRNQVDARWFPIVQRQPTSLNQGLKIDISLNKILFEKPLYSENECIENRTSYMVPVFLPLYFTYQNIQLTNPVFTQLADIPFMTKDGHFILNGTPRTIVQQLVRAPGIYYKIRLSKQNKRFYLISFLTQNGNWLRIWNTKKLTLWGRINRLRRVPVYFLLQSLGFLRLSWREP
jgi:DNA-directed RNA polymerase subunit beta